MSYNIIILRHEWENEILVHNYRVSFLVPILSHNSTQHSLFPFEDDFILRSDIFRCVVSHCVYNYSRSYVAISCVRMTK